MVNIGKCHHWYYSHLGRTARSFSTVRRRRSSEFFTSHPQAPLPIRTRGEKAEVYGGGDTSENCSLAFRSVVLPRLGTPFHVSLGPGESEYCAFYETNEGKLWYSISTFPEMRAFVGDSHRRPVCFRFGRVDIHLKI